MRALVQRSKEASVTVEGEIVGEIERGLVVLLGVAHEDTAADAAYIADKVAGLRIFEDEAGKMNLSLLDVGGAILSVSQFTLYGDARKGKRPNFMAAAKPEQAMELYERFNDLLRERGITVATGRFGEMMDVSLVNWGPVTIWLDSKA
jgi:D-aminoacyl-tRNA deacylase